MEGQSTQSVSEKTKKGWKPTWKWAGKTALNVAILLAVFGVGVGYGSGRITWGPDSVYRKTVQTQNNSLSFDGIEQLYQLLRQSFDGQLDNAKLEDGMKAGLVRAAGDPYTEYLNAEENKEFNEQLSGSFEGIGAELTKDNDAIVIVSPIAGYPAEKAGMKPKDIISKINGESALDITTSEAVKRIRGPKGTAVKLEVVRDGKVLNFEVQRTQISIPSVKYEVTADNIGVITVSRFGEDTNQLMVKAANDLKSKNVKGIVLDLRGNPGGLLDSAVAMSSLWLPREQTILEEKRNDQLIRTFRANGNSILLGVPTVVLINEGSASASEIAAGALRDNGVATIIGQKSYGKGSVQELRSLSNGGVLKVTIARWFTPKGVNIDKEGIKPDQVVELKDADVQAKNDTQKNAALQKLKQ